MDSRSLRESKTGNKEDGDTWTLRRQYTKSISQFGGQERDKGMQVQDQKVGPKVACLLAKAGKGIYSMSPSGETQATLGI